MVVHKDLGHYNLKLSKKGVPCGVGGECWTCDPRSIPGANNLKKLLIWMKIHGLTHSHKDFVQIAQRLDRMSMSVLKQTIKDK